MCISRNGNILIIGAFSCRSNGNRSRAKTISERLHSVKNNSTFEIAALFQFSPPKQFGEKSGKFEIGIISD